ncbi:hypothetical protein J3Q64DRAFT_1871084 [Phycomyces blakesleeanus]|uniref:Retrotransposon gag domain-containing protein n=1 Tax=Phycomyces blakesleeanus TaxID=4837 RepID=A0ABR3APP3_PHYBL
MENNELSNSIDEHNLNSQVAQLSVTEDVDMREVLTFNREVSEVRINKDSISKNEEIRTQSGQTGGVNRVSEVVYDDVDAFNSAYEFFITTAGLDCESRWKSFINAKKLIEEKFNSLIARGKTRLTMLALKIDNKESVEKYLMRFLKAASLAGISSEDHLLGKIFMKSLPTNWHNAIFTNLNSKNNKNSYLMTVKQVDKATKHIAIVRDNSEKRVLTGHKNKKIRQDFYEEIEEEVLVQPRNLRAKNYPFRATNNNGNNNQAGISHNHHLCHYCGENFSWGHKCKKYYSAFSDKRNNNNNNNNNNYKSNRASNKGGNNSISVDMVFAKSGLHASKWAPQAKNSQQGYQQLQ